MLAPLSGATEGGTVIDICGSTRLHRAGKVVAAAHHAGPVLGRVEGEVTLRWGRRGAHLEQEQHRPGRRLRGKVRETRCLHTGHITALL